MSRYYGGWAPYVPVAERRRQASHETAKLRKKGQICEPVILTGQKIATTFWGKAWCDNIESYHDAESRLPRGRSCVRNGLVVDLQILPGRIAAIVSGSDLYKITITIKELAAPPWRAICADCTGGIDSLVELLQGRFSKGVMERLCRQQGGLFPRRSEIRFSCSCPDGAAMCKHVAAALYGVGARLDEKPELLFRLRTVDEQDLIAGIDAALPLSKTGPAAGKVLETDDISALFGIDMAEPETPLVKPVAAPQTPGTAKVVAKARARPASTPVLTPAAKPEVPRAKPAVPATAPARAKLAPKPATMPARALVPKSVPQPRKAAVPLRATRDTSNTETPKALPPRRKPARSAR
jgi:uncharacterized Zn finger protein